MGASQLSIYNKSLRHLEERKLANLQENRESRRYLDDEWADGVNNCLHAGFWNHSMREIEVTNETTVQPNFGFQWVFKKPTDWVRTYKLSDNSQYNPLLRRYTDQNAFWYADITPLYVKYVSDDPNYGWNLSLWPPAFCEYVGVYLANCCAPRLKQALDKVEAIEKNLKRLKADALARDAMDLPPGERPYDTWVQARAPRGSILPYGQPFGGLED